MSVFFTIFRPRIFFLSGGGFALASLIFYSIRSDSVCFHCFPLYEMPESNQESGALPTCHHRSFEPPHLQESINRPENQTNTLASAPTVTDSICVRKFRFFGTVQSSLDNGVKPYCYCTVWKEWASPVQSGLCSFSIPD